MLLVSTDSLKRGWSAVHDGLLGLLLELDEIASECLCTDW